MPLRAIIHRPLFSGAASIALAAFMTFSAPVVRAEDSKAIEARLGANVKYLASDELEGRGVGTKGLDKAAEYLASEFSKIGLKTQINDGSPFQAFEITTHAELGPREKNRLVLIGPPGENGQSQRIELKLGETFNTLAAGGTIATTAPVVFVGYGISAPDFKYDDFAGVDVKDKVVVMIRKEPQQADEKSVFNGKNASSHAPFTAKISNAYQHGAAAVILVNDRYSIDEEIKGRETQWRDALDKLELERATFATKKLPTAEDWKKHRTAVTGLTELVRKLDEQLGGDNDDLLPVQGAGFTSGERTMAVFFAKREKLAPMIKAGLGADLSAIETQIDNGPTPASKLVAGWSADVESNVKHVKAAIKNVIAVLDGRGSLADETVVVGAHIDHVGMGGAGSGSLAPWTTDVHNGADDNASGTASLLEVARQIAGRSAESARRVVFIGFSGEERGLLGSKHYVEHPLFPLEKTVAMVNMDMVGRLNENKLTVFGTGTSSGFDGLIDRLNKQYEFNLTKDPAGEGPSDHESFFRKKVPVFHFFTGTHSDYHRPSDDSDKVNYEGMARITRMVTDVVAHLATTSERPDYVAVKGRANIARSDRPRPRFGSMPDYAANVEGCRLDSVIEDGPAAKGGLLAGDIIVRMGEHKVGSVEDFDQVLRKFRAGDVVKVAVKRGDKTLEFDVTLGASRG